MDNLGTNGYEVNLWEDEIQRDETGKFVHHPLNSRYFVRFGEDTVSYGHLTFAGHDLDKSHILDDVKVFYLEFRSDQEGTDDREGWADPLRVELLHRLSDNKSCWYLSIIDRWFKGVDEKVEKILNTRLNKIEVKSEKPFGTTYGFRPRDIYEIPNNFLPEAVNLFWSEGVPGYPIEGYNMEAGQIDILRQWDARPRDDHLFRDVIDRTFINFYTFPAENRWIVFVTNKFNYAELAELIDLEKLKVQARELGQDGKRS